MSVARMSRVSIVGLKDDLLDVLSHLTKLGVLQIEVDESIQEKFAGVKADKSEKKIKNLNSLSFYREIADELEVHDLIALNDLENVSAEDAAKDEIENKEEAEQVNEYFFGRMFEFAEADKRIHDEIPGSDNLENFKLNKSKFNPEVESQNLSRLLSAYVDLLEELIPVAKKKADAKKGLFSTKRKLSKAEYFAVLDKQEEIMRKAQIFLADMQRVADRKEKIRDIEEETQELRDRILAINTELSDINSDLEKDETLAALAGQEPELSAEDDILLEDKTKSETDISLVDRINMLVQERKRSEARISDNLEDVKKLDAEIVEIDSKLDSLSTDYEEYEVIHDFYEVQLKKLRAIDKCEYTDYLFTINSYTPAALSAKLKEELESNYQIFVDVQDVETDEDYPILLQNNKFARSFQTLVEMYALPKPGYDIDPTFGAAVFYVILFGMMLGDVGYGVILAIACAIGLFKFKVEGNTKKTMGMLMLSGIASIPFGFLFGGFFGDLLPTITNNAIEFKPLLFNPMEEPIAMLILSMGVGIIHLFAGMAIDIYIKTKRGDWKTGFFKVAPWYFIVLGLVLWIAKVSAGKYIALLGLAVLLLLGDQSTKNPIKRIFSGISSLTDITSWLSDALSYSRILALALSTSVIAMVVNILAMLVGYKGITAIIFVVILIFGHILDLALSGLSSYVHTIRLQYVEFFGKFYEGGGRPFEPLDYSSKFTKINEIEDEQDKIKNGEFTKIHAEFHPVSKEIEKA